MNQNKQIIKMQTVHCEKSYGPVCLRLAKMSWAVSPLFRSMTVMLGWGMNIQTDCTLLLLQTSNSDGGDS